MIFGTVTLTIDLLTPKPMGIIYGLRLFMISRNVNLNENSFKLVSGQNFDNAGRTDGRHAP